MRMTAAFSTGIWVACIALAALGVPYVGESLAAGGKLVFLAALTVMFGMRAGVASTGRRAWWCFAG
ncbi:hypothetical protein [Blastococcus sp. VKM Ac-2987]|uniref:hypothetical protein n=1 Tax=Blastococcus sp. VKM Ac-2987 TaxID=3004141 RepID=UPI0022AB6DEF|nr:hypothetical protein [Blastococcus sp. VKM Ac-2987]MCZ2857972.1 hypothetical protein [Blastococcus sp. VKM Ac-2987]